MRINSKLHRQIFSVGCNAGTDNPPLPLPLNRLLLLLNYALITGFMAYIIYAGLLLSWVSRARSFQGIPSISYSWVTMSLPVGAALIAFTTLLKLADALRAGSPGADAAGGAR